MLDVDYTVKKGVVQLKQRIFTAKSLVFHPVVVF